MVAAPRHRHHGRHGEQGHLHQILAPAPPQQPLPSAAPHHRMLEMPPSPSPNRPAYRTIEPLNPDASPWARWDRPCAFHGWGCPNRVALAQWPSSSSHQGEEEGREDKADERCITVLTGQLGHRQFADLADPRG
jgi:hypothetical protein